MNSNFQIIIQLLKIRFKTCIVYRKNFLLNIFFNIIWTIVQIIFINIIFLNTHDINSWGKYDLLLFFGVDEIIFPLFVMLSFSSFVNLEQMINLGTIDYVLIQPVNEKLYISLHNADFFQLPSVLFGICLIIYSLSENKINFSVYKLIIFTFFIVGGVWILNSLFVICVSLLFKYRKLSFIKDILLSFISAMSYPLNIYHGLFKIIIITVLPIGIIVDFPSELLLKEVQVYKYIYYIFIVLIFWVIQKIVWKKMMKFYTSSSS